MSTTIQTSGQSNERQADITRLMRRLHTGNTIATTILWVVAALVLLIFIAIIVYLIVQGFSYLINPVFYSTGDAGIGRELFNTFYILILTEIFIIPIGLASAIFLVEYAKAGRFITFIHFAAETLAGVPSIVLGLFGFLVFSSVLQLGTSRLAGSLTLLCLNFPLALRLFEDALASVPREMREGGLALGATKWHVIRTVVIPSALPGIITGVILTAGKIIGEAAALLFTMGLTSPPNVFTLNPLIASATLTTKLYYTVGPGSGSTGLSSAQEATISAGSAALLILVLLIINLAARAIGRAIQRRVTAA